MKKFVIAFFLILGTGNFIFAQISDFKLLGPAPVRYGKSEWVILISDEAKNPFLQEEITLNMLLTSPTGKKIYLPCYWQSDESITPKSESVRILAVSNDRSGWHARFTPQEAGRYRYQFQLNRKGKALVNSVRGQFFAAQSKCKGFLHLREKNDWILAFDNGQAFRGIGENLAWESRQNDDSKFFKALHENPKYNYEFMLPSLSAHSGNFFRTWICSWNLPIDWNKGFNSTRYTASDEYFNPSACKQMDRLVNLSDSLGVYMMLTLGMGAYELRDGGFSLTDADFFVNPESRKRYKNRLRYFIARWGFSPSIAAWELFNEVDNVQFGDKNKVISAESIVAWHDEMSTYIKAIDPYKHLVTTSISHRDLAGLNSLKNIDINQKHIYKNTTNIAPTINQYETKFQKPYVIGEYGYEWDWLKNFDDFPTEMDSDFKRGLWYGLFSPTPILPMSWWWEFFDSRGTDKYIRQVRAVSDEMLAAGNGSFEQVVIKSQALGINTFAIKCGSTIFVYAYNPDSLAKNISLKLSTEIKTDQLKIIGGNTELKNQPQIIIKGKQLEISGLGLPGNSDIVLRMSAQKN